MSGIHLSHLTSSHVFQNVALNPLDPTVPHFLCWISQGHLIDYLWDILIQLIGGHVSPVLTGLFSSPGRVSS